jgi:hypothetical protein
MDEVFIQNALAYAAKQDLQLTRRLGFGVHGIIFSTHSKSGSGRSAVKVHREVEPYRRERQIYERLKKASAVVVAGFNIPKLVQADDELRIIEMSIVRRPFVLDFAGAYLDSRPEFSEEIWADWEAGKRELFEARWPQVQAVLAALEELGIYMVDVTPGNVAFAN